MVDKAHSQTDKKLEQMEKHLSEIYARSQKELEKKTADFWAAFERKDNVKKKLVESGKMSDAEYKRWRIGQIMTGKHWEEMTKQVAQEMINADKTAIAYVNGKLPEIYALNYNAFADQTAGLKGYSFELVDANTVKNLATSDKTLLPYKTVDQKKVERWNTQKVNAEVMQGIIQGESVKKIAKRLENVVGMEKNSAIRNARTSTTSAENKGRMDSYHEARNMGIVMKKKWLSLHDHRTRDWHGDLDGVEKDIDEPFENVIRLSKTKRAPDRIMYPGDPDAHPANVYNCRCTLVSEIKGLINPETGEYREFQGNVSEEVFEKRASYYSRNLEAALGSKYAGAKSLIENSEACNAFEKYSDDCSGIQVSKNGGYYSPLGDTVHVSFSLTGDANEYTTVMHEMNHMIDHHMGRAANAAFGEIDKLNEAARNAGYRGRAFIKERPSQSDEFVKALRKDMDALKPYINDRATIRDMIGTTRASAGVQDALDGFYGTQGKGVLPWGHGDRYYNRIYNQKVKDWGLDKAIKDALNEMGFDASNQTKVKNIMRHYEAASEAWANVGSAVVCGGKDLEVVEKLMPNTLAAYRQIIGGVK